MSDPVTSSAAPASPARLAWDRLRRRRQARGSALLLGVVLLAVLLWPLARTSGLEGVLPRAVTWSPTTLTDAQFQPPSWEHWLGTDLSGRDLLSRMLYGARISLLVGLAGALVSLIIGALWGGLAGYLGGFWDSVLMRIVDVLYALPSIVFVMVLISVIEPALRGWLLSAATPSAAAGVRMGLLFVGLGAVSWLTMARIVRGQVLSLRTQSFVEASWALGASHFWILRKHILPNVAGVILVYLTLTIPSVILYESFLSYLGLGIEPPQASLGSLIADGATQLNPVRVYWWLIVFPGGLLAATLLALNLLGDALRDAWEPR